jgi:hypothetical protein
VHEDFSKLNPARMDTPIMPDAQYIASYKKYVDKVNAINKAASQGSFNFDDDMAILEPYQDKAKDRMEELLDREPRFVAAKKAMEAKEDEIDTMTENIAAEYDASPEGSQLLEQEKQNKTKSDAARGAFLSYRKKVLSDKVLSKDKEYQAAIAGQEQVNKDRNNLLLKIKAELRTKNPKLSDHELNGRAGQDYRLAKYKNSTRDAERSQNRIKVKIWDKIKDEKGTELEQKHKLLDEAYWGIKRERKDAHLAATTMKIQKLKLELIPLKKKKGVAEGYAYAPYASELEWLDSFEYNSFGRHYNSNYGTYFRSKLGEGGTGIPIHSDVGGLQAIAELGNNPAVWRTEVDWDWRTPEEESGAIANLPLMKKWIERNRGPIQKSNPAKSK